MEHEIDSYTNSNMCSWYTRQRNDKSTGGLGNNRTSGDHSNYSIVEIGQNTKKSPGDLRRLAICQTLVRNHRITVVGKSRKGINNIYDRIYYAGKLLIVVRFWLTL